MEPVWKRSTRSEGASNCVELTWAGAVRDSKNPAGPVLHLDVGHLLAAIKAGGLDR